MTTAEWNSHARISALMSGTPVEPERIIPYIAEYKGGKKISCMVPKTKFAYQFQLFDAMPQFNFVP